MSCPIYLAASLVLSGGKGAELKVVQYSDQAWLTDLPDLNVGRYSHACSSYSHSDTGSEVRRQTSHDMMDDGSSQILVVTGGYGSLGSDYLDTTETMREGGAYWTTLASARLPYTLAYFKAVTLNNRIFTFGETF